MGSRKGPPVTLRMDREQARRLEMLAAMDRRTRTAEVEHLVEQEWSRRESGAEPAVRVERLELRVQGWRETAAQLRSRPLAPDESLAELRAMADAYDKAADEVEMEIRTRG